MPDFSKKITITAVDKVTGVTKGISRSLDNLKLRAVALGTSFKGLQSAAGQFGAKVRNLGITAIAAGAGIYALVKSHSDLSEQLLNASQRAGVGVEALQKLNYSAELAGISTESLNQSLKFLNKSITEAVTNSGSEAAKAFKSMNISLKDANGNLKSADQVLGELSDKFAKAPDGAKKTTTAMTLLGRSGTEIIPILNQGSAAIKAQGEEYERLGNVLSKEALEAADRFGDNLQRVGIVFKGLTSRIAQQLIPILEPLINKFIDFTSKNKELIKLRISEAIDKVIGALKGLYQGFTAVFRIISPIIDALGGLKTIVIAFTSIYIAGFIASLAKLVIAIAGVTKAFGLLSLAFLATPVGFVVTAIALIVTAAYKLYKIWPEIKEIFVSNWDAIKNAFSAGLNFIKALLGPFAAAIGAPFQALLAVFKLVVNGINLIKSALGGVKAPNINIPNAASSPIQATRDIANSPIQAARDVASSPIQAARDSSPAVSQYLKSNSPLSNAVQASNSNRLSVIAPPQQQAQTPQKLDINMKIDAEGRPKDVKAKSNAPMDFKANTGVMVS